MGNLANKLNTAYAGEVKQALKAKSRSKELESLKLKLEDTKKNALETFTQSEEYNHEMAGVWQVLNMGSDGMAHHSLVHAARRKDKDNGSFDGPVVTVNAASVHLTRVHGSFVAFMFPSRDR
ncbi:hypothetical protein L3X38_040750 [Prunus dulcis]|uniref:Uncharacterized protein n=1 Tax=Prunus dulcis TaxID=3755 RepID=A0AAD4UTD5_PRUDU|nr:hypothetical protein L3X38_040750 [Prunus dulcis]